MNRPQAKHQNIGLISMQKYFGARDIVTGITTRTAALQNFNDIITIPTGVFFNHMAHPVECVSYEIERIESSYFLIFCISLAEMSQTIQPFCLPIIVTVIHLESKKSWSF